MLMALPISYLVTTFPIFLIVIHGCILIRDTAGRRATYQSDYNFVYTLAKSFMYVNNSINILFYILFGKNLRDDFLALLLSPLSCCGFSNSLLGERIKRPQSDHRFQSLTNLEQQDVRFFALAQNNANTNQHRFSTSSKRAYSISKRIVS